MASFFSTKKDAVFRVFPFNASPLAPLTGWIRILAELLLSLRQCAYLGLSFASWARLPKQLLTGLNAQLDEPAPFTWFQCKPIRVCLLQREAMTDVTLLGGCQSLYPAFAGGSSRSSYSPAQASVAADHLPRASMSRSP